MPKLFISYRRKDSADITGRLNDRLKSHFGDESIFLDIDSIPIGLDFRKELSDAVSQCDVLLAVIGPEWLGIRFEDGPEAGERRLENQNDYVRIEIHAALSRGIPVVPVLVGDARMPAETELPGDIKELAFRNAAVVRSQEDFRGHSDRLIRGLEKLVEQNREVRSGMRQAADLARQYPDLAVHSAGKLIASVVREIYERRFREPAGARQLGALVGLLVKAGYFPERFAEVVTSDAQRSLPQLIEVLEWYVNVERPAALGDLSPPPPATFPAIEAGRTLTMSVVPKGVRSFDARDADFFLDLLPGLRDKQGLPESVAFWKHRIESRDETAFTVGLIYGPSGCGKSSLVKAGLLPRLLDDCVSIYVEAAPDETEARLLKGLRKLCPNLAQESDLRETLAALHRDQSLPPGKKVLIVLDQFEQWLHARRSEDVPQLVAALRQCDGRQVQCIVLVRDDFWMAVTRFFQDLDIPLVEGQNSRAVDLFPLRHARAVLAAFGRAYAGLENETGNESGEQRQFLDQAIAGLADDGKVICVRLALFAEMMKGKSWTPATLREVGGTEGVGVTFLEETFSAASAPPERRYHQKAARAVLKALLPESGTDIKGHMRSYAELLDASGCAARPKDFADLVRILDSDVRLITPTDPEGQAAADGRAPNVKAGEKYYQLTHDYLVPSLRDWLTRKQRETRRGRAELLLSERTAAWNTKPEDRLLPSVLEHVRIRALTRRQHWTDSQKKLMRRARRVHLQRGTGLLVLLAVLTAAGFYLRARVLVSNLQRAEIAQVPDLVPEFAPYRIFADSMLHSMFDSGDPAAQLKAALGLLPVDRGQVDFLRGRLLTADPPTLKVIRDALADYRGEVVAPLWKVLDDASKLAGERFNAACALATYDPDVLPSPLVGEGPGVRGSGPAGTLPVDRWKKVSPFVADQLVAALQNDPSHYALTLDFLRPVKGHLFGPLAGIFRAADRSDSDRSAVTRVLADYAAGDAARLADLAMDADAKQFAVLYPVLAKDDKEAVKLLNAELAGKLSDDPNDPQNEVLAKRQANAAAALVRLGASDQVWPLFKHPGDEKHFGDPRVRSYVVDRLSPLGCDPQTIIARFDQEQDVSARRALILTLGQFSDTQLPVAQRQPFMEKLMVAFQKDPDSGLRGAAEWLLRRWGQGERLEAVLKTLDSNEEQLQARKATDKRQWYVNGQGQTFVILHGRTFEMGSPAGETDRSTNEVPHQQRIGRTFAISSTEVTKAQYGRFQKANPDVRSFNVEQWCRTDDSPQVAVDWYDAARYCNWLSAVEGIDKDQWCYEPVAEGENKGRYAEGMKPAADYLRRSGYRLPTEAEWEYACRAGTATSRYYGLSETLLPNYAYYLSNGENRLWPVASLKPNDFGLFDMLGNAFEWCDDPYANYAVAKDAGVAEDSGAKTEVRDKVSRVLRGGAFFYRPVLVRSAYRFVYVPTFRVNDNGFRPSRTYP